jgi:superfamily II DNA or RNA helicase
MRADVSHRPPLRKWQERALERWEEDGRKGIVSAVTGSGKTFMALSAIERAPEDTVLIVVPTVPLLEQWWAEAAAFFNFKLDDIAVLTGGRTMRTGTINIAVLNTAAKLADAGRDRSCFLIVDECHKAASPEFRAVFNVRYGSRLGLSATPERQYDEGFDEVLVPALGPIIYSYTYIDARNDGVIVPFELRNVVFELDGDTSAKYARLTKSIAKSIDQHGPEAQETVSLYLRRARVLNMAPDRVRLALALVRRNVGQKTIIFHEDIASCNVIDEVLRSSGYRSGVYHSGQSGRRRVEMLNAYRSGQLDILVTCRALDEGFNVPEAEIGIIAASTATRRQRIQRLGRVLRPSKGKEGATIYTLVATGPEYERLKAEEAQLEGVASVSWGRA